jgi:Fe-S oxidoreductase
MHLESQAGTRVNRLRFTEVEELAVSVVATGCPFCKTMMDDAARYNAARYNAEGSKVRVKDIAELVYEALLV